MENNSPKQFTNTLAATWKSFQHTICMCSAYGAFVFSLCDRIHSEWIREVRPRRWLHFDYSYKWNHRIFSRLLNISHSVNLLIFSWSILTPSDSGVKTSPNLKTSLLSKSFYVFPFWMSPTHTASQPYCTRKRLFLGWFCIGAQRKIHICFVSMYR